MASIKERLAAAKAKYAQPAESAGPAQADAVTNPIAVQLPSPKLTPLPPPPLPEVSRFLQPTPGVRLDYMNPQQLTHVTATAFARDFIAGKKRPRRDDEGSVRQQPAFTRPIDIEERYEQGDALGSGVYGRVFEALADTKEGRKRRAAKEILENWIKESAVGFPKYLLREFDLLMRLRHTNILAGVEIAKAQHTCSVFIISEHGGRDLKSFLFSPKAYVHLSSRNTHPDAPNIVLSKIKCIAKQLLSGLNFLHTHCVIHRDLKTSNVLIDASGTLRICDFGLARFYREGDPLTGGTVTLMYRPPELHFEIPNYSSKVDIWSAGCIIAELLLKTPLFRADDETEHFRRVCAIMGDPDDVEAFPGMLLLPAAKDLMRALKTETKSPRLANVFSNSAYRAARECVGADFLDFIGQMLKWNPKDRPDAGALLTHPWLTTGVAPCSPESLHDLLPHASCASPDAIALTNAVAEEEAEACEGKDQGSPAAADDRRRLMLQYDESGEPAPDELELEVKED